MHHNAYLRIRKPKSRDLRLSFGIKFATLTKSSHHFNNKLKMAQENQNKNQLQIQLRPEVADGKYSNLAMIGHGPNEFLMDFIFAAPGMPQAPVVSRVIMSPENAKQLMFALTDNIRKYEDQFGEIKPRGGKNPAIGNN